MSYFLQHEPNRGIGGEPKRTGDSPPPRDSRPRRQTASRQVALSVNQPSGGRFSNITEDVRKYAAEQALSEEEALQKGMAEKSQEFLQSGAEVYTPA